MDKPLNEVQQLVMDVMSDNPCMTGPGIISAVRTKKWLFDADRKITAAIAKLVKLGRITKRLKPPVYSIPVDRGTPKQAKLFEVSAEKAQHKDIE